MCTTNGTHAEINLQQLSSSSTIWVLGDGITLIGLRSKCLPAIQAHQSKKETLKLLTFNNLAC